MAAEKDFKSKLKFILHKAGVMFKNIWKLIKKLFGKLMVLFKENKMACLYGLLAVAIVLVFVIVAIIVGGDDAVVKKYAKGLIQNNPNKMYSTINSNYVKSIEDSSNVVVLDRIKETFTTLETLNSEYLSFKIVDSYELTEDEFESLKEDMTIYAPKYDTKKVKTAKRYCVKYKMKKNGKLVYDYSSIYIIKVGFAWSVVYNL